MGGGIVGIYQPAYWQSDGWGMNRRETQGGTYYPYLPDRLEGFDLHLGATAASAVSKAEGSIRALNHRCSHLTDTEPLARLILRSEALASSRIEGLEMGAGKLLEHEALEELGVHQRLDSTETSVLSNIAVMQDAVADATGLPELTLDTLRSINRRLLAGTRVETYGGELRHEQNWIGGNNVNPIGAAYVPPPPEHAPSLMEDLVAFCNRSPLPPVATAALAHAQLETIHPFADGNGRTGRSLIHIVFKRSGLAPQVVPPVSLVLATDKNRYINNLAAFRTDDGDYDTDAGRICARAEAANSWVEYFANACSLACERALEFESRMDGVQQEWRTRIKARRNSATDLLLEALPSNPVVSVSSAARLTGRSDEATRLAIHALVDAGILVQNAKNRKSGIYAARDALDAFTAYERALATPGGDTATAKPTRSVALRVPRERRGKK